MKRVKSEKHADLTQLELDEILESHKKWLESKGKEENRANLAKKSLQGLDLRKANLTDSNLEGTNFDDVDLTEANFRQANLKDADLENSKGLSSDSLAASDVTHANLPAEIKDFAGLKIVEESSKNAKKLFIAMIIGCIYSWLTIATTKDASLFTNSATSPLPIIGTAIPIVSFYIVAPIILLLFFIYFHLYLQRHCENISDLPAIFPDGTPLNKKIYPWLVNGRVCVYFKRLRSIRPPLAIFQAIIVEIALFMTVPITILLFLLKYLYTRYDMNITTIHFTLLYASLLVMSSFAPLQIKTLLGRRSKRSFKKSIMVPLKTFTFVCLIILFFMHILGTFYNSELDIYPRIYRKADLSGANFEWQDLHGADLQGASLIGANLHGANLKNANLRGADLRGANIEGAIIKNANFQEANLGEVKGLSIEFHEKARNTFLAFYAEDYLIEIFDYGLRGSMDHNEYVYEKDLSKYVFNLANLVGADFNDYNLQDATFDRSDLKDAIFENADLGGANLASAKNLSVGSLSDAIIDSTTKLPQYIIDSLKVQNDTLFLRKLGLYPYTPNG